MIGAITRPGPPPWQQCEVCRAARDLQLATDALLTYGDQALRVAAVARATAAWEHAKDGHHTGTAHAPVVTE